MKLDSMEKVEQRHRAAHINYKEVFVVFLHLKKKFYNIHDRDICQNEVKITIHYTYVRKIVDPIRRMIISHNKSV